MVVNIHDPSPLRGLTAPSAVQPVTMILSLITAVYALQI
jgi:hypothetical protein